VPLYFYMPGAEIERIGNVRLADDVRVSAGPRVLLEKLAKRIEKAIPEVTVVDPIFFRDAVFPDGGWWLEELMETERCERISQELGIRFLVLVGAGFYQVRADMGFVLPGLGAMTSRETAVLSAVVIDLEKNAPVCRLRSESEGTDLYLNFYIFVGMGAGLVIPSVERGVANALTEVLLESTGGAPARVALMGAEASGDPFVAYEGAPITVGRDAAVAEMINRLAETESEFVPGTTSRDEIRRLLGDPMASHAGLGVEVYRFTASAESRTRPLLLWWNFRTKDREERSYAGYLLVAYDAAGKAIDVQRAIIAADVDSNEDVGVDFTGRSGTWMYDYDFESFATSSVRGFRLEVRHVGQNTEERLYTEPEGVLVLEKGEWVAEASVEPAGDEPP